jgi:hypothetical protein
MPRVGDEKCVQHFGWKRLEISRRKRDGNIKMDLMKIRLEDVD